MGKSGKKIKSERINAIRKRYDAFLDEDKRRKDRNEFILGRLEKIRLSNAVVPVHHKGNAQPNKYYCESQERPEFFRKITRFDDSPLLQPRQADILPNCVTKDEQIILNEISKKYILIPKLRSNANNVVSYYSPPSASNDVDWKNKYSILDELKRLEKEPSEFSKAKSVKSYDDFSVNNDNDLSVNNDNDLCANIVDENVIKYPVHNSQQINEVPVSELQPNKPEGIIENIPCNNIDNENKEDITPSIVVNNDSVAILACSNSINQQQFISDPNNKNEKFCENPNNENEEFYEDPNNKNEEFYENENFSKIDRTNKDITDKALDYNRTHNIQLNKIKEPDDTASSSKDKIDENVIQNSVTEFNTLELSSDQIVDNNMSLKLIEEKNTEFNSKINEGPIQPIEIVESQPCENISSEGSLDNTPQEQYGSNNETAVINENVISSQIDEFEAEQKEMFYSEETEYNQNVDNMEYNAPNEYTKEQYSYYNQSQQDQPYYEVNEHEESTERYDPNYEQQYVNYEANDNVALYENQQYGENYENQPEITSENYEQQPINLEYVPTEIAGNTDDIRTENVPTFESDSHENIVYESPQRVNNELSEVDHSLPHGQNINENTQEYLQIHSEKDTIQNLEKQLDREEGYIEDKDTIQDDSSTEVDNQSRKSDIKVT